MCSIVSVIFGTLFVFFSKMISFQSSHFSLSPPSPRLQEVHNKWRQTQEAGRAVVLRSYFSSPLLPSQVETASTSSPGQLRQLSVGCRKLTLLFHPPSQKNNYLFPQINPSSQASGVLKSFVFKKNTHMALFTTKQGVVNTSSEALFKDNHCFFWVVQNPPNFFLPIFLSAPLLMLSSVFPLVPVIFMLLSKTLRY